MVASLLTGLIGAGLIGAGVIVAIGAMAHGPFMTGQAFGRWMSVAGGTAAIGVALFGDGMGWW